MALTHQRMYLWARLFVDVCLWVLLLLMWSVFLCALFGSSVSLCVSLWMSICVYVCVCLSMSVFSDYICVLWQINARTTRIERYLPTGCNINQITYHSQGFKYMQMSCLSRLHSSLLIWSRQTSSWRLFCFEELRNPGPPNPHSLEG